MNPFFLGLIPTRGCNLGCRYCSFAASKKGSPVLPLALARKAIHAYLELLHDAGKTSGEIHFFGGEPFYAQELVHFATGFAASESARLGVRVRFEATTNGFFSEKLCRWIAGHFDAVVLSLDGPEDIQDRLRPDASGRGSSQIVIRNARILSDGPVELVLRACVTQDTVARMAEVAGWFVENFRPSTVCFEALYPSPLAMEAGLIPPDPVDFARNFLRASRVLRAHGIEAVNSTGELRGPRTSCCPVGKDALIVSPDGTVDACYLLPEEWQQKGLDLSLGALDGGGFGIDPRRLQDVRDLAAVHAQGRCAHCLCRYSCAGGCHVNHQVSMLPGDYDEVCLRTRLLTIAGLLEQLGHPEELERWLWSRESLEISARQANDRLLAGGGLP
jgi:uncharacterized protein